MAEAWAAAGDGVDVAPGGCLPPTALLRKAPPENIWRQKMKKGLPGRVRRALAGQRGGLSDRPFAFVQQEDQATLVTSSAIGRRTFFRLTSQSPEVSR
jgi:hypothetical protein